MSLYSLPTHIMDKYQNLGGSDTNFPRIVISISNILFLYVFNEMGAKISANFSGDVQITHKSAGKLNLLAFFL